MADILCHDDIIKMRKAGKVAGSILRKLKRLIHPGISTKEIERYFDKYIGRYPSFEGAFKGYQGYPSSVCVSINDEIIHGIPDEQRKICAQDLVSVDLGIRYDGIFVDCAYTYSVGKPTVLNRRLIQVGSHALLKGIQQVRAGATIGDIGSAIQKYVEENGFSVVRKFVGHGIGRSLHCAPEVPNFGVAGEGDVLKEGMVLAIEPMITGGSYEVRMLDDGWTAKTIDGSLSSHFEHTVAVTRRGPVILTS